MTTPDGPVRVQLRRGVALPPNTIRADRATQWGNPFLEGFRWPASSDFRRNRPFSVSEIRWEAEQERRRIRYLAQPVEAFREMLLTHKRWTKPARPNFPCPTIEDVRRLLKGKNLADWPPPSDPSSADVLLEIANDWPTPAIYIIPAQPSLVIQETVAKIEANNRRYR